ncbi:MAG: carboxypeptidase-like regulatory domain-containing protein [Blastopirellula sp. JB062]
MISLNRFAATLMVVAAAMTAAGCGNSEFADLSRVTGQVTMDGQPLAGVVVSYYPASGRPVKATTDDQGQYDLVYIRDVRGAEPGQYKVEIKKEFRPKTIEESRMKRASEIPARYNTNSTLTAEVVPGENVIDFELTSQAR